MGTLRQAAAHRLRFLFALLTLSGCAGHFPPCPRAGGPVWRELSTENFRLWTDTESPEARAMIGDLELLRAALLTTFRAPPSSRTGQVSIVVLRDGWGDLDALGVDGFYARGLFQPFLVVRNRNGGARQALIKQGLASFFSEKVMPFQPRWYAEGVASYFETIELDADKRTLAVGRPPADILRYVQRIGVSTVEDMLIAKDTDRDSGSFRSTAWLMVHFLMNHHPSELRAFQAAVQRAPSERDAWASSFGDLTPAKLNSELRRYLDGGRYSVLIFPFQTPPLPAIAERGLTDADTHATRALLFAVSRKMPPDETRSVSSQELKARAAREVEEALGQDPAHPLALSVKHWELEESVALEQVRAAVARHPEDWMTWALLVEALSERHISEGQSEAADKAMELARANPAVTLSMTTRTPLE